MSNLLLKISRFLSIPIFTEWLTVVDWGCFDAALCRFDRAVFTALIRTYAQAFASVLTACDICYSCNFAIWATDRCISGLPIEVRNVDLETGCGLSPWDLVERIECRVVLPIYTTTLFNILFCARSLKKFSICDFELIDPLVLQLATHCCHLTSVDFTNCVNLTDDAFVALCRGCPLLASLGLWRCKSLSQTAWLSAVVHCRHLATADLRVTQRVSFIMSFHSSRNWKTTECVYTERKCLDTFISYRGATLEVLPDYYEFTLTPSLCFMCPLVTRLDLNLHDSQNLSFFLNDLSNFKNLKKLELCDYSFSQVDLTPVLPVLQALQDLSISIRSLDLCHLLKRCSALRSLRIHNIDETSDPLDGVRLSHQLQRLDCEKVRLDGKTTFSLRNLLQINFESCTLSSDCLDNIARNNPSLKTCQLEMCLGVNDYNIHSLFSLCTKLEVLSIINCSSITAKSLESIVMHHCRALRELSIIAGIEWKPDLLCTLLEKAKRLIRLQLSIKHDSEREIYQWESRWTDEYPDVFVLIEYHDISMY